MKEKTRDILNRALKTFVQATAAELLANLTVLSAVLTDVSILNKVLVSLAVGAVAAGISAVWNAVISPGIMEVSEEIEIELNGVEEEAPMFLQAFLSVMHIDLSDMTADALKKIVDAIGAKVNGNLKQDMIDAITACMEDANKTIIDAASIENKGM